MNISTENPIRLLDLNKYPLNDEQIKDKYLQKWTKEVIYTFTPNELYNSQYKNTVTRNVYNIPTNRKFTNYGARHFVMKQQCALFNDEIEELRKEAKNKYSPYWYGMISTCRHSAHISLRIAQMLFPASKWSIVNAPHHTFVTNVDLTTIETFFRTHSYNEAMPMMIDHAEYDIDAPMIVDILITNKSIFLGLLLVHRTAFNRFVSIRLPYESHISSKNYRKRMVHNTNIYKVPKEQIVSKQELTVIKNNTSGHNMRDNSIKETVFHNTIKRNTTNKNAINRKTLSKNVTLKRCSNGKCSIMG